MAEAGVAEAAADKNWHALALRDLKDALADRPWSRDVFLRGSLARGSENSESDIDLVVTVAEQTFDAAIHELSRTLPLSAAARPSPWLDGIVRDFGGIGLVNLLQVDEQKWGQVDVVPAPPQPPAAAARSLERVARPLHEHDPHGHDDIPASDEIIAGMDAVRRRHQQLAAHDVQQAALGSRVSTFLLRKRLMRQDRLQTFADTYATALRVEI